MISLWAQSLFFWVAVGIVSCAPPAPVAPAVVVAVKKNKQTPKPASKIITRGKVSSISLEDFFLAQQSGNALIYDARPFFFYSLGRIPGAINLPKTNCEKQIILRKNEIETAIAAKKVIVIYCTNFACPDARAVARHMAKFGYSSSTLTGGWDSWKSSGMPTE